MVGAREFDESEQPWQITLLCLRLLSALSSSSRLAKLKATDTSKYIQLQWNNLREMNMGRINSLSDEQQESIRSNYIALTSLMGQEQEQQFIIRNIRRSLQRLICKYRSKLEIDFRSNYNSTNDGLHVDDYDNNKSLQRMEHFHCGYFREIDEEKGYILEVPDSIKCLCFQYFGNILMNSNILDMTQIHSIGFLLKRTFGSDIKHFYAEKIYEAKCDGMDVMSFDDKCNKYGNILSVIQTNYGQKFASFSMDSYESFANGIRKSDGFLDNNNMENGLCINWSVFLQCNYKTVLYSNMVNEMIPNRFIDPNEMVYHIPNEYEMDLLSTEISKDLFPDEPDLEQFEFIESVKEQFDNTFADCLRVTNVEVFHL